MRLATFNILHGQRLDRPSSERPATSGAELAAAIAELDADVIGLQEVDVHQPRSGRVHQPDVVAQTIGAQWWRFVPTVVGTPGGVGGFKPADDSVRAASAEGLGVGERYGIALISKLPVIAWHVQVFASAPMSLPLLVQSGGRARFARVRDEPRAAIAVTLAGRDGPITVATAHLSFVPGYNITQLMRLKAWLAELPRPLVLMGDFNLPGTIPSRVTRWPSVAQQPTYPSYNPRIQFDHILVDGAANPVLAAARQRTAAISLPVSDHCALRTDIDL